MEGGAFAEWDFSRGLKEGWIPNLHPSVPSENLFGSCYDILKRTSDNTSILHEFPDPTSLDTSNWQGYPIDDDVVVSYVENLCFHVLNSIKHKLTYVSHFYFTDMVTVSVLTATVNGTIQILQSFRRMKRTRTSQLIWIRYFHFSSQ